MKDRLAIVAIAKDEGKFIAEWIAFHLSIGCDRLVVYLNDSTDETAWIIEQLGRHFPVAGIEWPSLDHLSPQRAAYSHAIETIKDCEWAAFIDIDEMIVPFGFGDIGQFIATIPDDVAAVGINWRLFGSSGRTDPNYDSVIHAFRRCSVANFNFNRHVKSVARIAAIIEMGIHDPKLRWGKAVDTFFEPMVFMDATRSWVEEGRLPKPVFNGIQVNHYALKTPDEFRARRLLGNANKNRTKYRIQRKPVTTESIVYIDTNDEYDTSIEPFLPRFDALYAEMRQILQAARGARQGQGEPATNQP